MTRFDDGGRAEDLFDRPAPTVLERVRFQADGLALSCPHCKANWPMPTPFRPCSNPFLAERLLLITFCRSCTSFSILTGQMQMRKPLPWESNEIMRTGFLMAWRSGFMAEQSGGR